MVNSPTTSPLRRVSSYLSVPMNWRERGVGISRIIFGLVYIVAATLKWQPGFQHTFLDQVMAAKDGQPALVQAWISFWVHLVSINPLLFAQLLAITESALALCLLLGIFSNLTYIVGIVLTLGIWSVPEGFGGPYVAGRSTDIGAGLLYTIVFAILLCLSAGRYYGLDRWLTPRLGRFGFLASGTIRRRRNGR